MKKTIKNFQLWEQENFPDFETSPGRSLSPNDRDYEKGRIPAEAESGPEIHVNYVNYDAKGEGGVTNYLEGDWFEIQDEIYDLFKSSKIISSGIHVDCEFRSNGKTLDFGFTIEDRDSIKDVEIQDEEIAKELGITEDDLADFILGIDNEFPA